MSIQQRVCSKKDEWYTPLDLFLYCSRVVGGFSYDLASSQDANLRLQVPQYFSQGRSFLIHHAKEPWQNGFWCNPPFSLVLEFTSIITASPNKRGAMLVNSNTETKFYQSLLKDADYIQFLNKRVAFIDGATGLPQRGNPKSQSLFFWGADPEAFNDTRDRGSVTRLR